jgi:predicted membrane channel-forming protein YqfA (hemolysin III family)
MNDLKVKFYVVTLAVCVGLTLYGYFWLATEYEVKVFYPQVILGFVWLGIGFGFYKSHWPESRFGSKFVHLWAPSHLWWHVFVVMNGYTMYWLCFDFCVYVESI